MNKKIITIALLSLFILSSCKESKQEKKEHNKDIVTQKITNIRGEKIEIQFDNEKEIAIVKFNNQSNTLSRKKTASGICYINNEYELIGKGNNLTFKKNDNILFENKDNIVKIKTTNKNETLNLVFNNSNGTVKVYLNGGKEINLKEKKYASGIWYSNDKYELLGKGDHYELKKGKEVLFKN